MGGILRTSQATAATAGSPAGNSPSAVSAAPDVPEAVPYRKGAGVFVPPGTSNGPIEAGSGEQEKPAPVEIPVKAHVRTVPAKPAAEKSLLPESITIEMLVSEFRRAQRITTQRVLLLGALCEHWIREQLARRTALDRATAVKKIREELAGAKLEQKEARVDLYVRCYWVAVLLSGWRHDSQESRAAANDVAFSALRLFPVLIERDRTSDKWQLIGRYAEAARSLWARTIGEHLSAKTVDAEISKILPARSVPIKKHRPVKLKFLCKLFPRLPLADVPAAIAELQAIQRQSVLPSESKAG